MCGSVMWVNVCQVVAPSTRAASMTSGSRDCSPANKISIMNGVHCQISWASTMILGWSVSQSGCGAVPPNRSQIQVSVPLSRP